MLESDDPESTEDQGPTPVDYAIFIRQLRQVLGYIASEPQGLLSTARREEFRRVLDETLGTAGSSVALALEQTMHQMAPDQLSEHGLIGEPGKVKLGGWRRAKERFLDWMNRPNARRALRWAGGILDSASSFVPPIKAVHELTMAADNLLADAEAAAR
ncbi:MAG TPA: hypothetical protein VK935_04080 [Actinomycetospora sp.]|nr:hypothetical protein [Actinomycetospora sp.]